ncbi:MAG: ATP-grasp domain-containing protein [Desulfoplanes sp.]|nr:ATP-grasp domain-containing protein [Desulfoplanes sp.]
MRRKTWIAVVRDRVPLGASLDSLDTLEQAAFVRRGLNALGLVAIDVEFAEDVQSVSETLRGVAPCAVFNLVESVAASSRMSVLAPVVYKNLGIPFTGSDESAQMLTADKVTAKRIMQSTGIPTPEGCFVECMDPSALSEDERWIVKSRYEHASIGLDFDAVIPAGSSGKDVHAAVRRLQGAMGGACLVERYISGREFSVSMLASAHGHVDTLPVAEMHFKNFGNNPKMLNYAAKWEDDSAPAVGTRRSFEIPSCDDSLVRQMESLAMRCWQIFGLSGYARVDFRVDRSGNPFVIDINPNPCIAEDAGFIAAAHAAGMSSTVVVKRILDTAFDEPRECVNCAV